MVPDNEPLLRVEFGREAFATADHPLQFIVHELGAICERMPAELMLTVNTARTIKVVITVE